MKVVRLSIIGNECVHCGAIITAHLKCSGCGWIDPLSRKPKDIKDDILEATSKQKIQRIVAGCIKTVKKEHGELNTSSLAKRIVGNIHGIIKDIVK